MSSAMAASPHQNGTEGAPHKAHRMTDFYQTLFQIRDDVFAERHPRIRLPDKVKETVVQRPAQSTSNQPTSVSSKQSTNGLSIGGALHHSLPPRPGSKPSSSAIDPVLLTKSDHLIRAELQLKRQQIERQLTDQLDKKGRDKDVTFLEETLDVENILTKALELVKPVSGLRPPVVPRASTESFDENSYYSSKANSWSSQEIDANELNGADTTVPQPIPPQLSVDGAGSTVKHPAPHDAPVEQEVATSVVELDEDPYEPADHIEIYEPPKVSDEREESDYSPPPADIPSLQPGRTRGRGLAAHAATRGSRRQSPVGPPPPIQNKRKRAREERRALLMNRSHRNGLSPEQSIKEESVSPPPLQTLSEPQPNKRMRREPERQRGAFHRPEDIEVVSARDSRAQPVVYTEQEPDAQLNRRYNEPLSPTVRGPIPQRRLERDDQSLRRVASLQHARRPYSPSNGDPVSYQPSEVRHIRGASFAMQPERSLEPIYREPSERLLAAPRRVRERSRSLGREYMPSPQSPRITGPPGLRIVVDQYGQQYYAEPVGVRESAAPPSRPLEREPLYQPPAREYIGRAPSRANFPDDDDVQLMPPPPPRRYVAPPDSGLVEREVYAPRTYRPIEADYEVIERRPVVRYEEMGPPREYIPSRAYSVRPDVIRREARDFAPVRYESVQPGYVRAPVRQYREVSLVPEHGYENSRYMPIVPAQGRHFEEEGQVERPMEAAQDPYARDSRPARQRY